MYYNYYNKLSKLEKLALNQYISSESYKINDKLRNNVELSVEEKTLCKNLDSAFNKLPKYKGALSRSLYFMSSYDMNKFLTDHREGYRVLYNEYISTTKGETYNPEGQVQIKIMRGLKGTDISYINKEEQEVLYGRGQAFDVIGVEIDSDGIIYIYFVEA